MRQGDGGGGFRAGVRGLWGFSRYFAPLFGRRETRDHSRHYLQALLVQSQDRRNAENLSESVGVSARAMQRFLTKAPWDDDAVMGRLQEYLSPRLGHPEAVWVLDGSDFPKQGRKSAGVARQYYRETGQGGQLSGRDVPGLCQPVGTSAGGQTAVSAGELDLETGVRRRGFRRRGRATGRRPNWRWICWNGPWNWATSGPGGSPGTTPSECRRPSGRDWWPWGRGTSWTFRLVLQCGRRNPSGPVRHTRDGGPRKPRLVGGQRRTLEECSDELPDEAWREITVAEGSQGPRSYRFSAQRVRPTSRRKTGEIHWAIYRRNLEGSEPRYYLSNAPEDTPLGTLAYVGGSRWRIETEFETEKGDVGLDEYETRTWAGWHHHIAMCLLGGAFLLSMQQAWGGEYAPGTVRAG